MWVHRGENVLENSLTFVNILIILSKLCQCLHLINSTILWTFEKRLLTRIILMYVLQQILSDRCSISKINMTIINQTIKPNPMRCMDYRMRY